MIAAVFQTFFLTVAGDLSLISNELLLFLCLGMHDTRIYRKSHTNLLKFSINVERKITMMMLSKMQMVSEDVKIM